MKYLTDREFNLIKFKNALFAEKKDIVLRIAFNKTKINARIGSTSDKLMFVRIVINQYNNLKIMLALAKAVKIVGVGCAE